MSSRAVEPYTSRTCLLLLAVLLTIPLERIAIQEKTDRTFESAACGVSFQHPTDWVVEEDTARARWDGPCAFRVKPVAWDSLLVLADSVSGAYTIWLQVETRPFDDVVAEEFELRGDGWIVFGRQGLESPAHEIEGRGWRGVRGTAEDGCHRIDGGYVGLCPLHKAVVGTDTRSVDVSADNLAEEVFDEIVATLQFRR